MVNSQSHSALGEIFGNPITFTFKLNYNSANLVKIVIIYKKMGKIVLLTSALLLLVVLVEAQKHNQRTQATTPKSKDEEPRFLTLPDPGKKAYH